MRNLRLRHIAGADRREIVLAEPFGGIRFTETACQAGGERLKKIGAEARADMERLFDARVMLRLWVKVRSGWADDERALRSLGYSDKE